eukprot:11168239-Lingulodinium_polyedra.AAC.1
MASALRAGGGTSRAKRIGETHLPRRPDILAPLPNPSCSAAAWQTAAARKTHLNWPPSPQNLRYGSQTPRNA